MSIPVGKTSKQRRNKRRSSVWKLDPPNLVPCAKCGELKMQHRVCKACGTYDGREVIKLDTGAKKKK